ncbi:CAP domain-containing protein [Streptomyces botrytidirepellens]|uniref:CAP domain-containing protein n=1 Tax=Streptomyces botrytidirepellens TaxID=2486417 RepID=A0A3M8VSR4_9ACTN|nr:CAP domain-containing protein [Streptomyces botrytidirepellens]RNG20754.1 CAP domain-containing protein [Streptomyces botrytidirepellens]
MGRHRRSAPGSATPPVVGAGRHRGPRRSPLAPVRTGLLSVSAAVAVGAVAMASGLVPGGPSGLGGGTEPAGQVQAGGSPSAGVDTQDPGAGIPSAGAGTSTSPGEASPQAPSTTPSKIPSKPAGTPSKTPDERPSGSKPGSPSGGGSGSTTPSRTPTTDPVPSLPPEKPDRAAAAEKAVIALVNQERAAAGCQPVTEDRKLAQLAQDFSDDMAIRDFFDHTSPDNEDPWDRAKLAGILDLGGENIGRGQTTAQDVMDSWMDSPDHRANILNCQYKTLGVGAHFGDDGPWWTQDFGY